jgi:lactoylglutathione lyase
VLSWINMKVPSGSDYVEFMLDPKVAPHFCLLVPDMEKAKARLESSPYRSKYDKPIEVRVGKNRKRQLNLYDPDGTRVELMEPNTVDGVPAPSSKQAQPAAAVSWQVGAPIATYWAGPVSHRCCRTADGRGRL